MLFSLLLLLLLLFTFFVFIFVEALQVILLLNWGKKHCFSLSHCFRNEKIRVNGLYLLTKESNKLKQKKLLTPKMTSSSITNWVVTG